MPSHIRENDSRTVRDLQVWPPLEAFAEEAALLPGLPSKLALAKSDGILPPVYRDHPVVTAPNPEGLPIYPAAIYVDGVAFSRQDTCLAFWGHSTS